ncbi:MAG: LytTR family DNA-binding domain-containing protein [Muribaculaceae bacterium]|nr:LytTR family DNA-binding domain-containing protein [Muribaculaceae bacterium]
MTPSDSPTLRCIVVDDEPLAAALISAYVNKTPFLELVAEVGSAADALAVLGGGGIDVVYSDIKMPGLSGIELARMLPPSTSLIFTTAFADYALEGYQVDALDYLLKPVSYAEFMRASSKALQRATAMQPNTVTTSRQGFLTVKSEYRTIRIPFQEIDYIEGLKDYVKIYVKDTAAPVLTLMSMKALEDMLPSDDFMRVHRSFIVRLGAVRIIERNTIVMRGTCIPVSESYRKAFFSAMD